jgi:hypothetical protein
LKTFLTGIAFLLAYTLTALAQTADCSKALIPKTTDIRYDEVTNLSLAWNMSEGAYNEAKQQFGANAVIYGVPIGANYGEFRRNTYNKVQSLHVQDFEKRAYAYATSALPPESLDAYKSCLLSLGGLSLVAGKSGSTSYTMWVVYFPPLDARANLTGKVVSSNNITQSNLQTVTSEIARRSFSQRVDLQLTVVPQSIEQDTTIDVAVGSQSRSLIMPPLRTAAPPPPPSAENIGNKLIGSYQVILGPRGGCGGGKPNSFPNAPAKIISDGHNLTAYNECGGATSVRIGDERTIYFYGEHAELEISGDSVIIKADDGNSWRKIRN